MSDDCEVMLKKSDLERLFVASSVRIWSVDQEKNPRVSIQFFYKKSFLCCWTINSLLKCSGDFSTQHVSKLLFLLDDSNEKDFEFIEKNKLVDVLASRELTCPDEIVYYESGEHVITPFEELQSNWKYRNVVKLCNMYRGRIDFVRLSCGGETIRIQNKFSDHLTVDDTTSCLYLIVKFLSLDYTSFEPCNNADFLFLESVIETEFADRVVDCDNKDNDEDSCKICFETDRDCVLQPCNHLAICFQCSGIIIMCPICKTVIENRIKIFKS